MPQITYFAEADLPDACFAYVPEEARGPGGAKSLRKLPLCDETTGELSPDRVAAAAAALSPGGFRGQRVQLPPGEREAVKARVRAAWKQVFPDRDPEEMPASIRGAEEPAEPEPDWFREFVSGLYARLRSRIAGTGFLTRDDFEAEVRQARSSVGGAARAHRQRQAQAAMMETGGHGVAACDSLRPKLEKAHESVNYREALAGSDDACGYCRYFLAGTCSLVEGTIDARMTCDLFAPMPAMAVDESPGSAYVAGEVVVGLSGQRPRLFAEVRFAEPPARVPILPRPGTYRHPTYGEIHLTPERIARFVANHNARVYGQDVPVLVDAEHNLRLYGAMGRLGAARVEPDGSATAQVEWTDRGQQLIREDRVRYLSPEWYDEWTDPVSGQTYRDVLVGLALTNRPFFKETVLAPLAANEAAPGPLPADRRRKEVVVETLSEEQVRALEERVAAQFAERLSAKEEALRAAEARVAALEEQQQTKAFTEEVMGRGDQNGTPWAFAGEFAGDYVAILRALPERERQAFVEIGRRIGRAFAELERQARLTSEIGSDAAGAGERSAWERIAAKARTYAGEHQVSFAEAVTQVVQADPELYRTYLAERRG